MARSQSQPDIKYHLLNHIRTGTANVAGIVAKELGLTRQAVNRHLRSLADAGAIKATGATRARTYSLVSVEDLRHYDLTTTLDEDVVWREFALPHLESLPDPARKIAQYGFTEMLNNAIDHSEGTSVSVRLELTAISVGIVILDDGVGIFRKIREALNLDDERHAILELSKGKLTTDPARHSGEGIFFASRLFDQFSILSGNLFFAHPTEESDFLIEDIERVEGTLVTMVIDPYTQRSITEVFDKFSSSDEHYRFTVTHIPVKLAQYGQDNLVSRSQAKRLLARVERFTRVILDFSGVTEIGQAFADEIFRVFSAQHPDIEIGWVNTSEAVEKLINRAVSATRE